MVLFSLHPIKGIYQGIMRDAVSVLKILSVDIKDKNILLDCWGYPIWIYGIPLNHDSFWLTMKVIISSYSLKIILS